MNKIFYLIIITTFNILLCQEETLIDELIRNANTYYDQGDYANAIIFFEDLLAEQEQIYYQNDMHIAKTLIQLGELYSLINMLDISTYYFQEAIIILEKSFINEMVGHHHGDIDLDRYGKGYNSDIIYNKCVKKIHYETSQKRGIDFMSLKMDWKKIIVNRVW